VTLPFKSVPRGEVNRRSFAARGSVAVNNQGPQGRLHSKSFSSRPPLQAQNDMASQLESMLRASGAEVDVSAEDLTRALEPPEAGEDVHRPSADEQRGFIPVGKADRPQEYPPLHGAIDGADITLTDGFVFVGDAKDKTGGARNGEYGYYFDDFTLALPPGGPFALPQYLILTVDINSGPWDDDDLDGILSDLEDIDADAGDFTSSHQPSIGWSATIPLPGKMRILGLIDPVGNAWSWNQRFWGGNLWFPRMLDTREHYDYASGVTTMTWSYQFGYELIHDDHTSS